MSEEQELEREVKEFIIRTLALEDIEVDEIESEAPLFGDGLGLDSVDALELGVALQKEYGITLSADSDEAKQHFASAKNLAALVKAERK